MTKILLTIFALIVPSFAVAAPFGITQGAKVATLSVLEKEGLKTYRVEVPEPNSNFASYRVIATPLAGVCAIFAETTPFTNWTAAKSKRDSVQKLLTKYGKPVRVKINDDWATMSARPPVDAYDLEWRLVPVPLSAVALDVVGIDGGQVVRLTYFFRNMAQCNNWEPKQDKRGL